jgi:opacity protein-like surface antigen
MIGWLAALGPAAARGQMTTTTTSSSGLVEQGTTGPIVWNLGGTLNVPLSTSGSHQYAGWGFAAGLTYNVAPWGGIQLEYGADWSTLKTGTYAGVQGVGGNTFFQYFNLNLLVRPYHSGPVGLYLVGGGGLYYRRVDVTQVTGTTLAPYCDPWLYYCSVVPVSTASLLGTRSSWNGGLDVGAGVTFALSDTSRLYLEARYHYVFGPSYTAPDGSTRKADGQFLPLTIGVRF